MKKAIYVLMVGLIFCLQMNAQKKKSTSKDIPFGEIKKLAYQDSSRLVEIFKDIHQNPELGFMETRTAAIVANQLRELGYTVITGIGKTGVAGVLKNGEGPVVMYRADMDCNAVKETTGLSYASTKMVKREDGSEVPVMHACGHDAHTTWLIGLAKIMIKLKEQWNGTLVLIAQPAEELGMGAQAMVKDRMYEKGVPVPDYLFGMHSAPVPVGYIMSIPGPRYAGTDQIDVEFKGVGGHGSAPHLAKDPVLMAAAAIMEYQFIVSRGIDPQHAAVLTVGAVQAGTDNNVIPASALLKINLRWYDESDRKLMIDAISRIDSSIALAYNLPDSLYPTMVMKGWAYPLINDTALSVKLNAVFSEMSDVHFVTGFPPAMGSEDVHHLVINNPKHAYMYITVGTANPAVFVKAWKEKHTFPFFNHNGDYEVDLSAIPFGVDLASAAVFDLFKK